MTRLVKLPFVVLVVLSLNAQVSAVLNRFPARSPEIAIQNNSSLNVVAFAVSMPAVLGADTNAGPFMVFVDSAIETDRIPAAHQLTPAMPLLPHEKYIIPVTAASRGGRWVDLFEEPISVAAVFADGSTTGDAALVSRLVSRRGSMLQAVELAREMVSDAGRHNVSRDQLVKQFRTMADSLNHWYLPPDQRVGRALYEFIVERLMDLPRQQVGLAFPPTSFVDQEVAELNRQRVALLESQPSLGVMASIPSRR